jgi:hypothetical protein
MKANFILLLGALSLTACGYGNKQEPSLVANDAQKAAESTSVALDFSQDSFLVTRAFEVPTYEKETLAPAGKIAFAPEDELLILDKKFDAQLGNLVRIGLDTVDPSASELERDFWVRERDLPTEMLEQYVAPEEIEDSLEEALARKRRMTYCYRFVKKYLLSTGQVKTYLPGSSAYQAYSILPKYGFHKTGNSPASARNGEVCVYAGGPQGHGHIEVKRSGKWWYGYGYKNNPIANRRFLGCFAKA